MARKKDDGTEVMPMGQNSNSPSTTEWHSMPAGTLSALASRLKMQRRISVGIRVAGAVCAVLVAARLFVNFASVNDATRFRVNGLNQSSLIETSNGGITCSEVRRATTPGANASSDILGKVQEHLRTCPACQPPGCGTSSGCH